MSTRAGTPPRIDRPNCPRTPISHPSCLRIGVTCKTIRRKCKIGRRLRPLADTARTVTQVRSPAPSVATAQGEALLPRNHEGDLAIPAEVGRHKPVAEQHVRAAAENAEDGAVMTHTTIGPTQMEKMLMSQRWLIRETEKHYLAIAGLGLPWLLLIVTGLGFAQQPGQKTFASADDASQALYAAAQSGDKSALLDILGPAGAPIVSSSDDVQDKNSRDEFVAR